MEEKCFLCKNKQASYMVRIAEKESGRFSTPVPLCKECLQSISAIRKTEIVSERAQAEPILTEHTSSYERKGSTPTYIKNIVRIQNTLDVLIVIHVIVLIICAIAAVIAFANEYTTEGIICLGSAACFVGSIISLHILNIAAEALEDYLNCHR